MNPETGAIAHFESDEDAEKAGHTVKLSKSEARYLLTFQGENRKERRAELARLRREKGRYR